MESAYNVSEPPRGPGNDFSTLATPGSIYSQFTQRHFDGDRSLPDYELSAKQDQKDHSRRGSAHPAALRPAQNLSDDKYTQSERNAVDMVKTPTEIAERAPVKEALTLVNTIANRSPAGRMNIPSQGVLSNLLQLYAAPDGTMGTIKGDCRASQEDRIKDSSNETPEEKVHRIKMEHRRSSFCLKSARSADDADEVQLKFEANKRRRRSSIGLRHRHSFVNLTADDLLEQIDVKNRPPSYPYDENQSASKKRRAHDLIVAQNVAHVLTSQNFILKLAKALLASGAPTHRIEAQLIAISKALGVEAQFIHLPSLIVASFGDHETRTSETHFVKAGGGLDLGNLHNIHEIYRQAVRGELEVTEASVQLTRIMKRPPIYSIGVRVIVGAVGAGTISLLSFSGSPVDAIVTFFLGGLMKYLQLRVSANHPAYANIFEVSMAMVIAFAARGLANTGIFCYQSISGASVVSVLPGYIILCGALELASKNMIAGAVRLVWAVMFSVFVAFGLIVGSDVFFLLNPNVKQDQMKSNNAEVLVQGGFLSNITYENVIQAWNGTMTYIDHTALDASLLANKKGSVYCERDPHAPWWQQPLSPYWAALLVPIYATNTIFNNLAPLRSRQFPAMFVIGCIGWVINKIGNKFIFNRSDVVSFLGAFAVGLLGNLYSRVFKGTAFTAMAPGVLFLVPTGIAAAGGLAEANTANTSGADTAAGGILIGFRIVQVAIGVTVGLFFSSFLVYSVGGSKKGNAIFAF